MVSWMLPFTMCWCFAPEYGGARSPLKWVLNTHTPSQPPALIPLARPFPKSSEQSCRFLASPPSATPPPRGKTGRAAKVAQPERYQPRCRAGFRACWFGRLSSRPLHETRKSREPADRNVCATSERMFQPIRRRPERSREFAKLSRQDFCALAHRTPFDRIEELL